MIFFNDFNELQTKGPNFGPLVTDIFNDFSGEKTKGFRTLGKSRPPIILFSEERIYSSAKKESLFIL